MRYITLSEEEQILVNKREKKAQIISQDCVVLT